MAVTVKKVTLWRTEVENRPGTLGDTLVTDEGLRSISRLTGLEELDLRGTQITEPSTAASLTWTARSAPMPRAVRSACVTRSGPIDTTKTSASSITS